MEATKYFEALAKSKRYGEHNKYTNLKYERIEKIIDLFADYVELPKDDVRVIIMTQFYRLHDFMHNPKDKVVFILSVIGKFWVSRFHMYQLITKRVIPKVKEDKDQFSEDKLKVLLKYRKVVNEHYSSITIKQYKITENGRQASNSKTKIGNNDDAIDVHR